MDDRRKNNRIDAYDRGLQVRNGITGDPLGIVGNLSDGGMMLITRQQLQAEGILQLVIEAPPGADGGEIPIGAKILWCTPANSPDEYWAGLEAIDISAAGRAALEDLLDHLASNA